MLDKVAADYADKGVMLAKVDVEDDKLIAAQFRVQSIPTVYAIFQGQPVADLTSYRTEGQLKRVIDQLLGQLPVKGEAQDLAAQIEPLIAMGEQVLGEGDAARAESIFPQIRDMAPDNPEVIGGLARALIAGGKADEARALLDPLDEATAKHPAIARARAALEVAAAPAADVSAEEARLAANPDDHEARFALAQAQDGGGRPRRARPTPCSRSSPATATGTRARRARASCRCWRPPASRTPGAGRSGGACRRCSSHDGREARANPLVPAGRGDPVPARAAAAAHFRAALSRHGARRAGRAGADRDDPAAMATAIRRRCSRPAASARSSGRRSWTTAATTSSCRDRRGSG